LRSSVKITFLGFAKRVGLLALSRRLHANGIRILCYHGVWLGPDTFPGDFLFIKEATFERRLQMIRNLGYQVITLSDAVDALSGRRPIPRDAVVITIDDGWYGTFKCMLPSLRHHSMPATLYCDTDHLQAGMPIAHVMAKYLPKLATAPGSDRPLDTVPCYALARDRAQPMETRLAAVSVLANHLQIDLQPYLSNRVFGYMTEPELRCAADSGLDIQLHTHRHTLHDFSSDAIAREIEDNRGVLETLLERKADTFRHFCYPSGVCDDDAAREVERIGMASSTTTRAGIAKRSTPLHLLPRIVDGEALSDIEFEAELAGFTDLLRRCTRFGRRAQDNPANPLRLG
jgi:peptidoglycan/xylan/chitin deacetylase (PgdA/CDA1 family)